MTQFILKAIISGIMVALISEVARRSTFLGGLLASLPITSLLAFIWLYHETGDLKKISELSFSILYLVIPSLLLFVLLPLFLKKWSFYPSLALACFMTALLYQGTAMLLKRCGILIMLAFTLIPSILWGHAGHNHGPTPGEEAATTGAIELSEEAIRNLGVESIEINVSPLQESLNLLATIEPLPEKNAQITARFEGRVAEILTKLGERVSKGQPLLKLDPASIGNPPVTIRSPIDGFVTYQNLKLGQAFTSQSLLMEVSDYSQVLVKGVAYENPQLDKIKIGQPAKIQVNNFPEEVFTGVIQRMDMGLSRETKASEIFAVLDNPELKLRPNMQATLSIGMGEEEEVLAVPARAILGDAGNYFVFVRNDHSFEKRSVVLGIRSGDQVEIIEGVFPGEKVVIQGNYQLQYATSKPKAKKEEHQNLPPSSNKSFLKWIWIPLGIIILAVGIWGWRMRRSM